ncbi:MAG: response regulator transcription factor [Verrucomicrobiota bacterium]|nr:response regulator transcription factor [Verrucomicrobiota bacterium]
MPIKVSIVEDDTRFRESLEILIGGADGFRCIGAYPNAEIALKEIPAQWPDVLLMDINLPKMSGVLCVSKLKAMKSTLQVIMLTAYVDNEQIFDSLKAGASGYLIKKTSAAKLLEAIADVHAGGAPMSNNIARQLVEHFQQKQTSDKTKDLSPREYEILSHLAKGHQTKEIGDILSISTWTVRAHIRNIYEKLHVQSRTEAVLKFLNKSPE